MKLDYLRALLRESIYTITSEDAPTEKTRTTRALVEEYLARQATYDNENRARGWPDCTICGRPFSVHSIDRSDRRSGLVCSVCTRKHRVKCAGCAIELPVSEVKIDDGKLWCSTCLTGRWAGP